MSDGQPVLPDAVARERALDPGGSFIVQAPAGSGKTELLTRRILVLLGEVDEPEDVLAITFTNKAASEMRQRVVSALVRAASVVTPTDRHDAEGLVVARRALARDRERGWNLVADSRRLALRTIDTLTRSVVTAAPLGSSVGWMGETLTSPEPLYRLAAHRFVMSNREAIAPLLVFLDNDFERLESLLVSLLAIREQWTRYLMDEDVRGDVARAGLERTLERLVQSRLQAVRELMPADLEVALPSLVPTAGRYLKLSSISRGVPLEPWQQRIVDSGSRFECSLGETVSDLPFWRVLADLLLTKKNEVRQRVSWTIGCPGKGSAKDLGIDAHELAAHNTAMRDILRGLANERTFLDRLASASALPEPRFADDDWARLQLIVTRLPNLLHHLELVFADSGKTDFTEVARRAVRALKVGIGVPDGKGQGSPGRPRHILLDEFQDTSRAQLTLLESLVAGWMPGDGHTLFVVGDPMQSIYRFRESDVSLFLKSREAGIGRVPLTSLRLVANFRSAPTLVDWFNQHFPFIFPAVPDRDLGAVPYEPSVPIRETEGRVRLHPVAGSDAQVAADQVARLVLDTLADDPDGSIGILLRTRARAEELLSTLRAHGIDYRALGIESLSRRPVVVDLITLAFALLHPHDRLHWVALLRGPLCGLTLVDLHALAGDDPHAALVGRLENGAPRLGLASDGSARVARLADVILPAVRRASREHLVPWIEAVWLRLGGPAACESDADVAAAESCLARLADIERSGRLWERQALFEALDGLHASDPPADGIRVEVMTLHHAKGLEFDHVIVPRLESTGRMDDKRLIEWHEGVVGDHRGLLIAPIDPPGIDAKDAGPLSTLVRETRARRCS